MMWLGMLSISTAVRVGDLFLRALSLMNNTAWKSARKRSGLIFVFMTWSIRLADSCGAACVSLETRKVLLGHRNGDITTHYSVPELQELLDAANKVCRKKPGTDANPNDKRVSMSCKQLTNRKNLARPEGLEPPATWIEAFHTFYF